MIQEAASLWIGIKKYEEILERNPQALSFAPLAELYRKVGLIEDALEVAKRGAALYPDFAAGQMALARIYLDKSMKREGTAALETVVRITPENTEAQRLLATLYTDAGKSAAAESCLAIANALEPDFIDTAFAAVPPAEPALPVSNASIQIDDISLQSSGFNETEELEEELLDADILELTDELEEEQISAADAYNPFAAAPERPSLQATAVTAQPLAAEDDELTPPSPVASATIAELYVSQGFNDKGVDVYRELLLSDPENAAYRKRIDELTSTAESSSQATAGSDETTRDFTPSAPAAVPPSQEVEETLQGWLSNIRRVKECRSELP